MKLNGNDNLRTECLNTNQIYLSNYKLMEKLIELLNEFDIFREYVEVDLEDCNDPIVLRVISKNYGFIKWLVDNDKIDIKKMYEKV